jgi:hypothetical protein
MLPMEATDPTLPMERNEPSEAMDSAESRDHSDDHDRVLTSRSVAPGPPGGNPSRCADRAPGHRNRPVPTPAAAADEEGMSIHAVAEDRQVTSDAQVIAELATGALESIARIHAAGLARIVDIAENPVVVHHEPAAETPAPAEVRTEVEEQVEATAEEPAVDEEPVTDQFAVQAEVEVVQPVEVLRAVPVSTRGRHVSEAETTEFAASRAA